MTSKKINDDEKTLGMLAHLVAIFAGFIGPLVIFLIKKKGFAHENAKNALNFTLSMLIYNAAAILLSFTIILMVITIPAMIGLSIFALVVKIIGAVRAYNKEVYKYPLTIPFIK
ncbi:MAG: DUF4870 domain-containing protein [Nanobdellota archaeon]